MVGRVHFLTVYEHFMSKRGNRIIKPTQKYFDQDGALMTYGCMILRECFLREAGLKTYWF